MQTKFFMKLRRIFFVSLFSLFVLCQAGFAELIDNGDGTVTDTKTGLMWQKVEAGIKTWEAALSYTKALKLAGHSDWRLPNRNELESIVDYRSEFPDAMSSQYWSSTSNETNSDYAWTVAFLDGGIYSNNKDSSLNVRAVRGEQ